MTFDTNLINILWSVPFAGFLLSLSLMPLFAEEFWHKHDGKIAAAWSGIVLVALIFHFGFSIVFKDFIKTMLTHYIPFIFLGGALYTITSGVHIAVKGKATPLMNAGILIAGGLLANIFGTTGASILLIRPMISLNKYRQRKTHIVIFFIFIVANIGGSLTPLGDPPLFLGFLEGVPFFWTVKNMLLPFLMVLTPLILIFMIIDSYYFKHDAKIEDPDHFEGGMKVSITGRLNLIFLCMITVIIVMTGLWDDSGDIYAFGVPISLSDIWLCIGLLTLSFASWQTTSGTIRHYNNFTWGPLKEVAIVFAAIFITLMPVSAMLHLGEKGPFAGLAHLVSPDGIPIAQTYFWLTGALSAFLDNAPTYLLFFYLAGGKAPELTTALSHILAAISCGAVFMGAMTYIGNAPNFMVRAIAVKAGVKMPSFLGYMAWSCGILLPIFGLLSLIYFK